MDNERSIPSMVDGEFQMIPPELESVDNTHGLLYEVTSFPLLITAVLVNLKEWG